MQYIGVDWRFHNTINMHNKYEGWQMFVFYPKKESSQKVNIEHKNGKFIPVRPDLHIAIEHLSYNPTGTNDFHSLVIAVPKDKEFHIGTLKNINLQEVV